MRLEVRQLTFTYRTGHGQQPALKDVDLDVDAGEKIAVVGPSGCGKSTLLQVIAGLLRPQEGSIAYEGRSIGGSPDKRWLVRQVGVALQRPEQQLFAATTLDEVMFGPLNLGLCRSEAQQAAVQALLMVGLDPVHVGRRSPFSLSGGQQRRVALASALVMQPRLLVLDEPTVGLHPGAARELISMLDRALATSGASCVMATHDLGLASQWADRMAVMSEGRMLAYGHPGEVWRETERAGLLSQELSRVVDSLRACGLEIADRQEWDVSQLAARLHALWCLQ